MKYLPFFILILLSFTYCSPKNNTNNNLDNIMGVWNRTLLDDASGYEPDDGEYQILNANGKKYAGYLNSLHIEKVKNNVYGIFCNGYDIITNSYFIEEKLILELICDDIKSRAKISITYITENIIYFTLLEGKTYTEIDYGQEKPYIRARLLFE